MVLGPSVQAEFGLAPGDTVAELERRSVPAPVVDAARLQAAAYRFEPRCSRYFAGRTAYLVLLVAACRPGEITEDGRGMAVYDASGRQMGRPTPWLTDHYVALSPRTRDRQ